jgi:hypothetical protein
MSYLLLTAITLLVVATTSRTLVAVAQRTLIPQPSAALPVTARV